MVAPSITDWASSGLQFGVTSIGVTFAGTPANGEIIVLRYHQSRAGAASRSWPSGFAEFWAGDFSDDGNNQGLYLAWKEANGESGATYNLGLGDSSDGNQVLTGYRIIDGDPADFPHVMTAEPGVYDGFLADGAPDISALTTTRADCLVCFTAGHSDSATLTATGFTMLQDSARDNLGYKTQASAGSTGAIDFAAAGASTPIRAMAFVVAPAGPPSAALGGTAAAGINEADIVAGGKTVTLTLTGDTWKANTGPNIQLVGRQRGSFAGTTSNVDVTFALSGGLASTPAAGDFVFVTFAVGKDSSATSIDITTTGGVAYTDALGGIIGQIDTNTTRVKAGYRFMPGTPETQIRFPGGSGNAQYAGTYDILVLRGVDPTTPLDGVTPTTAVAANGRVANPPSITPATAGAWTYHAGAGAGGTGGTYTSSDLLNFLAGTQADTFDSFMGAGLGVKGWTSGAVDPAAFGGGGTSTTSDSWAAFSVAIRPYNYTEFNDERANIAAGLDSAQSEANGWDAEVKPNIPVGNVVRTSATVVTITLPARAAYNITATETITATIPGSALNGGAAIVASPTFAITTSGGGSTTNKTLDVTVTATPTIVRRINKALALTVTPTRTLSRQVGKAFAVTSTTTSTLRRQTAKPLAVTSSATATLRRQLAKAFAVTATATPTLTRQAGKALAVTSSATATLARGVAKSLSVTSSTTSTITRGIAKALGVTATATPSVTADFVEGGQTFDQALNVTATATASIVRQVGHALSVTATATPTVQRHVAKALGVTVTGTASLARQIARTLAVTVTATATVTRITAHVLTLAATVTATPTITRQVAKVLSGTATATVTIRRGIAKTLGAIVSIVADLATVFISVERQPRVTIVEGSPPWPNAVTGSPPLSLAEGSPMAAIVAEGSPASTTADGSPPLTIVEGAP